MINGMIFNTFGSPSISVSKLLKMDTNRMHYKWMYHKMVIAVRDHSVTR